MSTLLVANWIFHISAGEFCDAAQWVSTTIARLETATAQIIAGI